MFDSFESTKKSVSFLFCIEIGHYGCSNYKQARLAQPRLSRLFLKPYTPKKEFDYARFSRDNFRHASSLTHVPHLEYYWENCPYEFEVRKRLWCRLTINQINMFNVDLNTHRIKEDEVEEVIDPFYVEKIKCIPIPKLDQTEKEQDDLLSRALEVLKRIEKWLKSKNVESTTLKVLEKYLRAKLKKTQPKPKAISNLDVANSIVGSPKAKAKVEVEVLPSHFNFKFKKRSQSLEG